MVDAALARRLGGPGAQQGAVQQELAESGAHVLGEDGAGVPAGVQRLDRERSEESKGLAAERARRGKS